MSGLARVLAGQGYRVSGCDTNFSPVLQSLDDEGIAVFAEHDARHVEDTDLLLWSPAVASDNPERVRAAELGVATLDRASMLAKLGNENNLIGVTGTHGKTTATSMLAWIMEESGRNVGRLLGADIRGLGSNGHFGPEGLVVEARVEAWPVGILRTEGMHAHQDWEASLAGQSAMHACSPARCALPW